MAGNSMKPIARNTPSTLFLQGRDFWNSASGLRPQIGFFAFGFQTCEHVIIILVFSDGHALQPFNNLYQVAYEHDPSIYIDEAIIDHLQGREHRGTVGRDGEEL